MPKIKIAFDSTFDLSSVLYKRYHICGPVLMDEAS